MALDDIRGAEEPGPGYGPQGRVLQGEEDPKVVTEFGATVYSLMAERGMRRLVDLAKLLEDDKGKPVNDKRLSPWLRGVHAPPNWLPRAIRDALHLDEAEQLRLARAFAFGADRKVRLSV